jgi:hypothetical protein
MIVSEFLRASRAPVSAADARNHEYPVILDEFGQLHYRTALSQVLQVRTMGVSCPRSVHGAISELLPDGKIVMHGTPHIKIAPASIRFHHLLERRYFVVSTATRGLLDDSEG